MAKNPVIVPYFDLSLQHAAGSLLRAMRRPGDGERHLDLIGRIRSATSESAMRSSFIVGFPARPRIMSTRWSGSSRRPNSIGQGSLRTRQRMARRLRCYPDESRQTPSPSGSVACRTFRIA